MLLLTKYHRFYVCPLQYNCYVMGTTYYYFAISRTYLYALGIVFHHLYLRVLKELKITNFGRVFSFLKTYALFSEREIVDNKYDFYEFINRWSWSPAINVGAVFLVFTCTLYGLACILPRRIILSCRYAWRFFRSFINFYILCQLYLIRIVSVTYHCVICSLPFRVHVLKSLFRGTAEWFLLPYCAPQKMYVYIGTYIMVSLDYGWRSKNDSYTLLLAQQTSAK